MLEPDAKPKAAKLAEMLHSGTVFNLYDYVVGYDVAVPNLMSLRKTGDGLYSLEATDDVTLTLPGKWESRADGGSKRTSLGDGESIPLSFSRGRGGDSDYGIAVCFRLDKNPTPPLPLARGCRAGALYPTRRRTSP